MSIRVINFIWAEIKIESFKKHYGVAQKGGSFLIQLEKNKNKNKKSRAAIRGLSTMGAPLHACIEKCITMPVVMSNFS